MVIGLERKSVLNDVLIGGFLFLFIYNIPFSFLPMATAKLALLVAMAFLIFSYNEPNVRELLNFRVLSPFLFALLLMAYSLLSNVYNHTTDFTFAYTYFLFLLEYLVGAIVIVAWIMARTDPGDRMDYFLKAFVIICVIQSVLIFLMLFHVPFREISFSIINSPEREEVNARYGGFRGLGYAASVTYDFAVLQSMALMFIPYLTIRAKRLHTVILLALSYFIILGGVLISGRTGLLGVFLSACLMVYHSLRWSPRSLLLNKNFLKSSYFYLFILTVFAFSYFFFLDATVRLYLEEFVFPYAFELFINFFETGSAATRSTDNLSTMYFPIDWDTFFWGDGYYSNPYGTGFYRETDAGYMRQILFYGVFGSLLLYFFYMVLVAKVLACPVKRDYQVIFLSLVGYLFVVQYKGDILMGSSFCIKVIFILYLLIQTNSGSLRPAISNAEQ